MTPEEYKAAKSAMYQKYKAGQITNYFYIQWKKKNDPSKQPGAAATPSPAVGPGTAIADQAVLKTEKALKPIYKAAAKEMQAELAELQKEFGPKYQQKLQDLKDGKITQAEFDSWAHMQTLQQDVLKQKIDACSGVLLNANEKAAGIVNGKAVNVFAENANWQSYQLVHDANINLMFSVYDERTVERLIRENPELIPRKVVNGKKDKAWNKKLLSNAVTQAIIQGDSIPKLARRVAMQTGESNMKAMMRYARTAMTGAQNGGRMDSLHRAKGMGIQVKKVWLATLDSRTRDSHQHLDGKTAEVDDKFPNGLLYPGDLGGPPGEIWNCRCTLTYDYEGFPADPTNNDRRDNETGQLVKDMTYDEWKAAKKASKLNELNLAKQELAEAQKAVLKAKINEAKVYSNIWKDPVTLADYPAKKASIQAKKDYYTAEIAKIQQAQANGESWATDDKLKEKQKQLRLLKEYEKNGALLEKRDAALAKVQAVYNSTGITQTATAPAVPAAVKKAAKKAKAANGANTQPAAQTGKTGQFDANAWDPGRKKKAVFYKDRNAADKVLRPRLDADWDTLTDEEKYAVWEYTHNSHPINRPLSGYNDTWKPYGYIGGPDKTEWGYEDNYNNRNLRYFGEMGRFGDSRGQPSFKKVITKLTQAIDRAQPIQEDMWLVRGSDENGLAGWFRGAGMDYNAVVALFDGRHTEKDMQQALVGRQALNHAFTSTGIAKDSGFGGNVKYRIYAPKGTHGIYAEPQSHYGGSMGQDDKIYKKGSRYSYVGGEAEIILQRGTTYVCTGIRITGHDSYGKPEVEIEMEIQEQPDYFKYGDEDTYNGGKTRHKK